jgi:hypothetical protein
MAARLRLLFALSSLALAGCGHSYGTRPWSDYGPQFLPCDKALCERESRLDSELFCRCPTPR